MPEWNERDNWWAFINGRPEYEWDPPKRPKKKRRVWDALLGRYVRPDDVDQYEVSYSNMQETRVEYGGNNPLVMGEYAGVVEEGEVEGGSEVKLEEDAEVAATLLPTPHATPQPEVRYRGAEHRQPTMTLLKEMDNVCQSAVCAYHTDRHFVQRYALKLLQFFAHWINRYLDASDTPQQSQQLQLSKPHYITQNHSRWIFALLSRLDDRLLSDELNELRNLARASVRYLKDLKKEVTGEDGSAETRVRTKWVGECADAPMDEAACWITIAAVAEFWGQKDLWMDAEVALR